MFCIILNRILFLRKKAILYWLLKLLSLLCFWWEFYIFKTLNSWRQIKLRAVMQLCIYTTMLTSLWALCGRRKEEGGEEEGEERRRTSLTSSVVWKIHCICPQMQSSHWLRWLKWLHLSFERTRLVLEKMWRSLEPFADVIIGQHLLSYLKSLCIFGLVTLKIMFRLWQNKLGIDFHRTSSQSPKLIFSLLFLKMMEAVSQFS